jgi:hypothetical protein
MENSAEAETLGKRRLSNEHVHCRDSGNGATQYHDPLYPGNPGMFSAFFFAKPRFSQGDLVASIYDAVNHRTRWTAFLERLAKTLHSRIRVLSPIPLDFWAVQDQNPAEFASPKEQFPPRGQEPHTP